MIKVLLLSSIAIAAVFTALLLRFEFVSTPKIGVGYLFDRWTGKTVLCVQARKMPDGFVLEGSQDDVLGKFISKYPQYQDVPRKDLVEKLYNKSYSDIDRATFDSLIFPQVVRDPLSIREYSNSMDCN